MRVSHFEINGCTLSICYTVISTDWHSGVQSERAETINITGQDLIILCDLLSGRMEDIEQELSNQNELAKQKIQKEIESLQAQLRGMK